MAIGPIDYQSMMAQLDVSPLLQGIQLHQQKQAQATAVQREQQQMQLAQQQFQMKAGREQDYQAAVAGYKNDPTPENLRNLSIQFPEHATELQAAGNSYTAAQKNDMISTGFSAMGALAANRPDVAIDTLKKRTQSLQNSGIDASHTQAIIDMINKGDIKGATAYPSYAMSGLVGPEHTAGVMDTLGVGAKADQKTADAALDRDKFTETKRHNLADEGTAAKNAGTSAGQLGVAQARERREAGKQDGAGGGTSSAPPGGVSVINGRTYVKRGGKWFAE